MTNAADVNDDENDCFHATLSLVNSYPHKYSHAKPASAYWLSNGALVSSEVIESREAEMK